MKQINSCLLFVLFSFFSLLAKAQFDVEKYDKECFLVGTLDEYMGYDRTFEVKGEDAFYQRVEKYRLNELSTVLFLSSLFDSDYYCKNREYCSGNSDIFTGIVCRGG